MSEGTDVPIQTLVTGKTLTELVSSFLKKVNFLQFCVASKFLQVPPHRSTAWCFAMSFEQRNGLSTRTLVTVKPLTENQIDLHFHFCEKKQSNVVLGSVKILQFSLDSNKNLQVTEDLLWAGQLGSKIKTLEDLVKLPESVVAAMIQDLRCFT